MTDPDLYDTMVTLAKRASEPPADLIDRVVARQHRRRRRQAVTAAFVAVLALGVGVLGSSWPHTRTLPRPAATFQLPSLPSNPPSITQAWPSATMTAELPRTPDGTTVTVLGRFDSNDLLVGNDFIEGGHSFLWRYSVTDRTYERLFLNLFKTAKPQNFAFAGGVLAQVQGDGRQLTEVRSASNPYRNDQNVIATTPDASPATGVYVDDRYVYWTFHPRDSTLAAHIMRVALAGGEIEPLAGFEGLTSNGSSWARNSDNTVFRNLSTGEERHAVRPPDTGTFGCVPAFCLGHDRAGWFLQRLDGNGRTDLRYPGTPRLVGAISAPALLGGGTSGSGLLLLGGNVLLDPVSGRYGAIAPSAGCDINFQPLNSDLVVRWRTSVSGHCTGSEHTVYLGND